ncbi:MAG: hypothetical protein EAZ28_06290 [Oscillatoriales cyanobacterium]|nr:MAG: hypothetical protein EAZ28_06290 [Oscillatoriales cyanobacterium]
MPTLLPNYNRSDNKFFDTQVLEHHLETRLAMSQQINFRVRLLWLLPFATIEKFFYVKIWLLATSAGELWGIPADKLAKLKAFQIYRFFLYYPLET